MANTAQHADSTGEPAETAAPYGAGSTRGRVRIHHLQRWKEQGQPWPMLTAYDMYTARIFDEAGIPVLLVGDSAANNVYGYESSLPISMDELLPLTRAVTRSAEHALVVVDLPFGSYQASPEQAVYTAARFMKEGRAHAVKLEGGQAHAAQIEAVTTAGIPVMAHLGFTPQSEHGLGGYRVQGRGDEVDRLLADARAVRDAGAFAVVLEMVPADAAERVTAELDVPTVGIGAGPSCDAQVLVWTDMAGMNTGRTARFVKRYAELGQELSRAAQDFAADVRGQRFPDAEHSFH